MNRHHWLEIVEYASLATSAARTLAAVASGQVVYAAAPLTLTLSLNLANRKRFQDETRQQLETVQQRTAGLDERTEELSILTHKLDEMQQQLNTLQQILSEYAKTEDLEDLLDRLQEELQQQMISLRQTLSGSAKTEDLEDLLNRMREEFSDQVDSRFEKLVDEFNQLLTAIRPAYNYELN